jgi:hypothetical protein
MNEAPILDSGCSMLDSGAAFPYPASRIENPAAAHGISALCQHFGYVHGF